MVPYNVYTSWLYYHTNGGVDLRDITKLLPKAKPEKKKPTKSITPDIRITDVDRFCEILGGITIHNYTVGGRPMN